jgi:ribonucleoside-diphosphate reductase beta chain
MLDWNETVEEVSATGPVSPRGMEASQSKTQSLGFSEDVRANGRVRVSDKAMINCRADVKPASPAQISLGLGEVPGRM